MQSKFPYQRLNDFINDKSLVGRVVFIAESQGRRESVLELLKRNKIKPTEYNNLESFIVSEDKIGISVNALANGFSFQLKGTAKEK